MAYKVGGECGYGYHSRADSSARSSLQLSRATRRMCALCARHRLRRCCRPRETQQRGYGQLKAPLAGLRRLSFTATPASSTLPPPVGLQMGLKSPLPEETTASSISGSSIRPHPTLSGHLLDTLETYAVSTQPQTVSWRQARGMRECALLDIMWTRVVLTVAVDVQERKDMGPQ